MHCASCGAESPPEATFCHRCGATFGASTPASAQPALPVAAPVLRVGAALREAAGGARALLGPLLATQGLFILALVVFELWVTLVWVQPQLERIMAMGDPLEVLASSGMAALAVLGLGAGALALQACGSALGISVVDAHLRKERVSLGAAWRAALPRMVPLVLTLWLVALAMLGVLTAGIALAFLIVPPFLALAGIVYLFVRWAPVAPVVVLERLSLVGAVHRASTLSAGMRAPILGVLASIVLLATVVPFVVTTVTTPPGTIDSAEDPVGAYRESLPTFEVALLRAGVSAVFQLASGFVTTVFLVQLYRRRAPVAEAVTATAEASEVRW